ncbi:hypothetical protein TDB9533_04742 [Thalassocella blandensis]|nr:hypothetical protein TDB9533_04742 [Thalassocella blandensis]
MAEYKGSEDVFKELVEDSEENWLYGLVAFAIIEERRFEWMKHFESHNQIPPSEAEIQNWYKQQPRSEIIRAKGEAESALQTYASEVIDVALEEKSTKIEEGIIVSEIRESRRFWPQFGVNFIGGLAASVVFAALLILLAFFVLNDTSPAEIGSHLKHGLEEGNHGQEN